MLKNIKLKFGRAEGLDPQTIKALPITIFVGPNNSGKSKILSELQQFCSNSRGGNSDNVIIDSVELAGINESILDERIKSLTLNAIPGKAIKPGYISIKKGRHGDVFLEDEFRQGLITPNEEINYPQSFFLKCNTLTLNGSNRINLVEIQKAGDLKLPAQSSFQVLFKDDNKRKEVRRIIHEAFDQYLVIDPTQLGYFNLRLSEKEPKNMQEEKGIGPEAVKFHNAALSIIETSDGVKAFTGMIIEMIAGDPSILLMDEPEAFLHPPLTFKLGKEFSRLMAGTDKRLFVATHSPNFVMGCIQSGVPVNIVRLTYKDAVATARILPNEDILKLMRKPLLRSTGVLSGLFYECVIVTESDTDRAFYQEINERLLQNGDQRGILNCLFLNAQNKQTVEIIIKPLRELGIPVAGIVDIDVIKDGGKPWTNFLNSASIPDVDINGLNSRRSELKQRFEESGRDMKKDGGIQIFSEQHKEALQNFFDTLANYGLFVVPNGEVESWLRGLNASSHGPHWLVEIFEKMGEDPASENYLKPDNDDVWQFIGSILSWFSDPRRKGIPK